MNLFPVDSRIRHKKHGLEGRIKHHEYNKDGVSPLPYCVGWDDSDVAAKLLGWFFVYPAHEDLELIHPVTPRPTEDR